MPSVELKNVYQEIPEHEGNYFNRNPLARDRMMSTIYTALGSRPLNGRIAVVSRYGDYVYVDNQTGDIELNVHQVMAQETVRWGLETEDFLRVFLPETDPWHTTHEQLLTLARPLRTSYETLGVILYSIPLDELNDLCKSISFEYGYIYRCCLGKTARCSTSILWMRRRLSRMHGMMPMRLRRGIGTTRGTCV